VNAFLIFVIPNQKSQMARTTITISTETNNDVNELRELLTLDLGTEISKHKALCHAISYTKTALRKKLIKNKFD
jgi:hypothetical protein